MGKHKGAVRIKDTASPMLRPLLSFFHKCPGFIETALYCKNMSELGGLLITQMHKDVKGHTTIHLHMRCRRAGPNQLPH